MRGFCFKDDEIRQCIITAIIIQKRNVGSEEERLGDLERVHEEEGTRAAGSTSGWFAHSHTRELSEASVPPQMSLCTRYLIEGPHSKMAGVLQSE